MKSYEEVAKEVFRRRDQYMEKQKRKKRIIKNIAVSVVSTCLAVAVALGLFLNNPMISHPSDTPSFSEDYHIDSLDEFNFYLAKKVICDSKLYPAGMSNKTVNYAQVNSGWSTEETIGRKRIFTVSVVTYFTITLNDENGFLAKKLGGTGLVEVVITNINIVKNGRMITFKKGDKYYSCLMDSNYTQSGSKYPSYNFVSSRYISGFKVVTDYGYEAYQFMAYYDGTRIIDFKADSFVTHPFVSIIPNSVADDITFNKESCIAVHSVQTITVKDIEDFLINGSGLYQSVI